MWKEPSVVVRRIFHTTGPMLTLISIVRYSEITWHGRYLCFDRKCIQFRNVSWPFMIAEWLIAFCYLYLHCCYTRRNLITLSTGLSLYKHYKISAHPSSSSRDHKQGRIDVWTDWWKISKHMMIFSICRILLSAIGEGEGQESRAVAGKPLDAGCYFGQLFLGYFIAHAHQCQLFHFRHKIW